MQLEDGDIICFQKAPAMDNEKHIRYPYVPSYLEYAHNLQVFSFSRFRIKGNLFCRCDAKRKATHLFLSF
jgi:hypothetical protein